MNWTDIAVAFIAASGGFLGAVISNNKRLAVLEAKLEVKLDSIEKKMDEHSKRIDAHNHLNERLTKLEVLQEVHNHES